MGDSQKTRIADEASAFFRPLKEIAPDADTRYAALPSAARGSLIDVIAFLQVTTRLPQIVRIKIEDLKDSRDQEAKAKYLKIKSDIEMPSLIFEETPGDETYAALCRATQPHQRISEMEDDLSKLRPQLETLASGQPLNHSAKEKLFEGIEELKFTLEGLSEWMDYSALPVAKNFRKAASGIGSLIKAPGMQDRLKAMPGGEVMKIGQTFGSEEDLSSPYDDVQRQAHDLGSLALGKLQKLELLLGKKPDGLGLRQ